MWEAMTHKTTNLRGFTMNMPVGTKAKAMTNMTSDVAMRPPKSNKRSHRLTETDDASQ